jgi:hypothetical protein
LKTKYPKFIKLPGSFEMEKSSRLGSRENVAGSMEVGGGNVGGPREVEAAIIEACWLRVHS